MRRPTSPRRLLAAVSAAALLLAVTGCGSEKTDSATDAPAEASSSSSTVAEPSDEPAEVVEGEEVDLEEFLGRMQAATEDLTTAQTSMTMSAMGMDISSEGSIDYSTDPPEMSMSMTMPMLGQEPMEILLVDGDFYMNMGALSSGKFWKLDPEDKSGPLGDMSATLDSMDPTKSLDSYIDGFKKVVFVGEEEVDGETLFHYELTLDSTKLSGDAAAVGMPEILTYQLWLDDEDRTRKAKLDMGDTGSMEMEVFAYGEPVTIEAPPADQIAEIPAGMGG